MSELTFGDSHSVTLRSKITELDLERDKGLLLAGDSVILASFIPRCGSLNRLALSTEHVGETLSAQLKAVCASTGVNFHMYAGYEEPAECWV